MSMTRKLLREQARCEAEKKGYKPSKFINYVWNKYETEKFGAIGRALNKAKGSAPKYKWKERCAKAALEVKGV